MPPAKILWRGFFLLWSILAALFLFGVVRAYLASDNLGWSILGLGLVVTLGLWAAGLGLAWGAARLVTRYLAGRDKP